MPTISRTPLYNLKAVLKEIGLTADVLRAWERRYGLPMPQRTPGGHRLYSEHDIETVKWLKARRAEGLSIGRAVELWKELVESGRDPLAEYPPEVASPFPDHPFVVDAGIETLRHHWLKAGLAFDETKAEEVLNQAFAIYPVDTVCTEIIQSGLRDIGEKWYVGEATVQQEHFASALAIRRLEALLAAAPRPTRKQTVLLGCPSSEWHTFSILLLSLLLRRKGIEIVYLGASVPVERLGETAAVIQPDLVVLAAQQLTTAATLQSAALALQGRGFPLAYGGLIFNRVSGLGERIPAYFLGESVAGALQPVERLIAVHDPFPTAISVDETYQELSRSYRVNRPQIEIVLHEKLQKLQLPTEYIRDANSFFGNGLSAALELGDMGFLEADLEWVKGLLTGRQIPGESLISYLAEYSHAIRKVMGGKSALITDWIDTYIAQNKTTQL